MNQFNIGILIISFFIAAIIVYNTPEDVQKNKQKRDDKIIKHSKLLCEKYKNISKANKEIDQCQSSFVYKNTNQYKNIVDTCRKKAYQANMIKYNEYNEGVYITRSYIEDLEENLKESSILLSNGKEYKMTCDIA